jgi:translin
LVLELDSLAETLRARLEAKHAAREHALRESRHAIRCSANAIRAIHRGDCEVALALLSEANVALRAACAACAHQPEVEFAGFIFDAQKEYAEARTTFAIITGQPLPGPEDLDMRDAAWLNGLAETIGELRRQLLDVLRSGCLERCEELLEAMDDIYALLVTIDFPEGITGGLRRATDIARSIIERTRGDLTNALVQARLRDALETHRTDLLGG